MSTIVSPQRIRYRAKLQRPNPVVVACANSSQVRRLISMAKNPSRSLPSRWLVKRFAAIALAFSLALVAGTCALILANYKNPVSPTRPAYVITNVLRRLEACTTLQQLPGIITPSKRSEMGFVRTGRVKRVFAVEGDCVEAGVTLAELDASSLETELTVAKTELKLAENRLRTVEISQPVVSIKRGRGYSSETLTSGNESSATLRTRVEHWASVVRQLELQIDQCQLRAPYKAIVVKTHLSDGSVVAPDRPVMTIVSHDELTVKVAIPLGAVEPVRASANHAFTIGNRQLTGTLKVVSPDIDGGQQTCDAIFHVPDLDSASVGVPIQLNVDMPTGTNGFRIPKTALQTAKDGTKTIFVIHRESPATKGNHKPLMKAREHKVVVLQDLEDSLLISGDVEIGDRIVADSQTQLSGGQQVWYSERLQWLNECWPD